MRQSKRKSTKHQTSRYRISKYSPNVYDVSVITAFVILLLTVTYVSVGPAPGNHVNTVGQTYIKNYISPQANAAGSAYVSLDDMVCVKNDYGDVVCASVGQLAKADDKIFSNCIGEHGCTLSCTELTDVCTDSGSLSACTLQNKFC